MLNLWVGIFFVWIIAIAFCAIMIAITHNLSRAFRIFLVLFSIAWIVFNARILFDNPTLTHYFPWKNMLALGSLQPFSLAMLIGSAWHEIKGHLAKRILIVCLGIGVCSWQCYGFLFRPVPQTRDRWKGDVCRQTTYATCSAAAAVTLLKLHGITSTEGEMAQLCFTSQLGTTKFGLYRGLSIKTENSEWQPRPLPSSIDALINGSYCPAIISVRLDPDQNVDPRYVQDWGWQPGVSHTVVILGFRDDGKVDVADPSVGREQWDLQGLRDLWKGKGFYLARK